jgi:hypothetical protein
VRASSGFSNTAQLAREYVDQGVHVVHTILNGAAGEDEEAEKAGKKMNPYVASLSTSMVSLTSY